jgi:hypothetical protein
VWLGHFRHAHRREEFPISVAEPKRRASDLAIAGGAPFAMCPRAAVSARFSRKVCARSCAKVQARA